ncbi:hypothetical protein ATY81_26015 [Rhizobium sp. R72]|uniref:DUF2232 domain-containing protein n=1 Tax=unclassified Rhizobium TaxID=2613769 RepID=UPI000B52DCF4|nr:MULTISPECIES: DUF2232 domain-containing protein [unclassified Rhizobium]OWV95335.1 hypothetical protein ATY79_26020 [Rhizobium sp. R693]OWV99600.1 hypothetical protein ATY81_26015 [Rhizobium sp. R72]OWV99667.1 hypothetical protein ATY80_26015 [Rhizobium sp. R711]
MNQLNTKTLGIGALAGLTAALLVLGASLQPSFSAVLYAASALPILLVGLGWGNMAAIAAVVTAAAVGAIAISPSFALMMTLVTLLPAGWLSHLANLARPASELGGPEHLMAWYPLSDILLHLCGLVTIAVIVVGVMIGYGPELIDRLVDVLFGSLAQQQPEFSPDPAVTTQTKSLVLLMLPAIQGGMWVVMLFAAYYVATRIVSASGRSLRPREDIPSALRMNRNSIFVFLVGLAATFFGGMPAMIGATVVGTFGAGFLLSGFAALHFRTRGKDWRLPALILCYLASLVLMVPAFFILVVGLSDTRKAIALTPNKDADAPKQTDSKI